MSNGENLITISENQLAELQQRWEQTAERQKERINNLSGIIENAQEILRDSALSPETKVSALKRKLL